MADLLLDPDCRDGKHRSCVGEPCECECHYVIDQSGTVLSGRRLGKVTDLMRVAQYVKSDKTAPSDVYNAACRLLDSDLTLTAKVNGALYRSAENAVTSVIAELSALDTEMDEFEQRHNPDCECDTIHATRETVRRIRVALNAPESHGDERTPQTQGASEGPGAREAQEGSQ